MSLREPLAGLWPPTHQEATVMASEDLLKKAVAAFNALSPVQQAEMLEEQRQSWVRGNVGLSRDERGMTPPRCSRIAGTIGRRGYRGKRVARNRRRCVGAWSSHPWACS